MDGDAPKSSPDSIWNELSSGRNILHCAVPDILTMDATQQGLSAFASIRTGRQNQARAETDRLYPIAQRILFQDERLN